MKVVFLEDVQGVANGGEIKEVKNGFARNYLIPKKTCNTCHTKFYAKSPKINKTS